MVTLRYHDVIFSLFSVYRICGNVLSYLKTLNNNNNNNNNNSKLSRKKPRRFYVKYEDLKIEIQRMWNVETK